MDAFSNVTIHLKANRYFEDKVTSRTVEFGDGSKKTLGIMLPGEYEFGTGAAEIMEILDGECTVLLPGEKAWKKVVGGERFEVPSNARFGVRVEKTLDYICSFIA